MWRRCAAAGTNSFVGHASSQLRTVICCTPSHAPGRPSVRTHLLIHADSKADKLRPSNTAGSRAASTAPTHSAASVPRRPHAPAAVNAEVGGVETPALLIDLNELEHNISVLEESLRQINPNVSMRPHAKAHKTSEITLLQMRQARTVGVTCQKVSEAIAVVEAAGDVLLASQLVSAAKARRLAALARRGCTITSVVDSTHGAEVLSDAARLEAVRLGVLIDINVGQNRCGVDTPQEAVLLAKTVSDLENLHLRGIQAYHGGAQHIRSYAERTATCEAIARKAAHCRDAIVSAGFECPVVSGGGTGTYALDAASGVFTEVQPGSYVFNDLDYAQNLDSDGQLEMRWRQSLFVAATVVSRNDASRRVVVDAGTKAISFDSGPPGVRGWPNGRADVLCGGDEHTILHVHKGTALPELGAQLQLVPGHCDPTVNLHDYMLGIRDGLVESVWAITGRGPGL